MFTKVLSGDAQGCLAILGKTKILPKGTYLAGGTALALHFGHRVSVDLDFFTPESFDQPIISLKLKKLGKYAEDRVAEDTLLWAYGQTHCSLFTYPYPVLFSTHDFLGVSILDPREIGAMKLGAVMNRGTKKDFVDLYELSFFQNISLDSCLEIYREKYGNFESRVYSILLGLSYFAETEETEMPQMFREVNWEKIKRYFIAETVRLKTKYL